MPVDPICVANARAYNRAMMNTRGRVTRDSACVKKPRTPRVTFSDDTKSNDGLRPDNSMFDELMNALFNATSEEERAKMIVTLDKKLNVTKLNVTKWERLHEMMGCLIERCKGSQNVREFVLPEGGGFCIVVLREHIPYLETCSKWIAENIKTIRKQEEQAKYAKHAEQSGLSRPLISHSEAVAV